MRVKRNAALWNIKYKYRIYNFLPSLSLILLRRHLLSGVVSLLDVMIHHQVTKQFLRVFPDTTSESGGLLVSVLVKTVMMILSLNPQ